MSLQDQGMRFVIRVVDGRIDGNWMHPADIKPQWLDCTAMDDNTFCRAIQRLQFFLERNRELDRE